MTTLRAVARTAMAVGAIGSVGLMLWVGRNSPRSLMLPFAIWVASPFVLLAVAERLSTSWSALTRATLYAVTLVVTMATLAVYTHRALSPPGTQGAFVFTIVPPVACVFAVVALALAALVSGRNRPR